MNNRHKYFRNLRYKQKLESLAHPCKTYWSHVMFITEDIDTKDLRENALRRMWIRSNETLEEAITHYIEWDRDKSTGKFIYFDRPEVPYSIHKVHTDPRYSRRRKDLCKYSNNRLRQRWKQYGETYQHCEYKKVVDVKWELD